MKTQRSFIMKYFPYLTGIFIISIALITWHSSYTFRRLYLDQTRVNLEARSNLMGNTIQKLMRESQPHSLIQDICEEYGRLLNSRFTVIEKDGRVIFDSDEKPEVMDNHADRPEVITALQGGIGMSMRYSTTVQKQLMYVAVPVNGEYIENLIVRSAFSVSELQTTLDQLYARILMAALAVGLLALFFGWILAVKMRYPIEQLKQAALKFGEGRLDHRVRINETSEFQILSEAMNQMAEELNRKLITITEQRRELEGVLSAMTESVIVISRDERVLRFNKSAALFFNMDSKHACGKSIQEVTRNMQLIRFIQDKLKSETAVTEEIIFYGQEDRFLQAHGTVLKNGDNQITGVLIVLNDITRMKRLQNIRKDFVANVSHELKTPITAIIGSVETLNDGAAANTEDLKRFLKIIEKHTNRLNCIIEDLLNLSRIEEEQEKNQIEMNEENVENILNEAVFVCKNKAAKKNIEIEINCQEALLCRLNAPMMEMALINLIDNAVKYSGENTKVILKAFKENDEIHVTVQDFGCGISSDHIPRIFERFYRVEKSRSRDQGGTGLGLSIVKHIIQSHNGSINVKSKLRECTVFEIILPSIHPASR